MPVPSPLKSSQSPFQSGSGQFGGGAKRWRRGLLGAILWLGSACMLHAGEERALPNIRAVLFDLGNTLVHKPRRWVDGARKSLEMLSRAGIPAGIISNTGHLTREQLLSQHLPEDFSFEDFPPELVLLSSEVGFEKPNLAIFGLAAERAGLLPGEILFLDENLLQVLAAQQAGLHSLRISVEMGPDGSVVRSDLQEVIRELVDLVR